MSSESGILQAFKEETSTLSGCLDLIEQIAEEDKNKGKDVKTDLRIIALDDRYHVLAETTGGDSDTNSRYHNLQKKLGLLE